MHSSVPTLHKEADLKKHEARYLSFRLVINAT